MGNCSSQSKVATAPKRKKRISAALREAVWNTWIGPSVGSHPCLCCRRNEIRQLSFHCGHVLAETNGGQTTIDNLRPICAKCNLSMGKQDMREFQKQTFPNADKVP